MTLDILQKSCKTGVFSHFLVFVELDAGAVSAQQQAEKKMHSADNAGVGVVVGDIAFHKYILDGVFDFRGVVGDKQHIIGAFFFGVEDAAEKGRQQILLREEFEKSRLEGIFAQHQRDDDAFVRYGDVVSRVRRDDAEFPGEELSGLVFENHAALPAEHIVDFEKIVRVHFFDDVPDIADGVYLERSRHDCLCVNEGFHAVQFVGGGKNIAHGEQL